MRRTLLISACLVAAAPLAACNGGSGDFCGDLEDALAEFRDVPEGSPEALREHYQRMDERLDAMAESAPEELADEVEAVDEAFADARTELEAIDYDTSKLPGRGPAAFGTPEFAAAATTLDEYGRDECDIDTLPEPTSSTTTAGDDDGATTSSTAGGTTDATDDTDATSTSSTAPEDEEAPSTSLPPS